ncbi:hypothetical protein AAFC00_002025 [Neodothiora populina]|uniref:Rab-GAP TBC domain-containing protein n=1 Tax=Neodothiora populina TaxID=2781224 RepID=A0ABR3PGC4_9PEZI
MSHEAGQEHNVETDDNASIKRQSVASIVASLSQNDHHDAAAELHPPPPAIVAGPVASDPITTEPITDEPITTEPVAAGSTPATILAQDLPDHDPAVDHHAPTAEIDHAAPTGAHHETDPSADAGVKAEAEADAEADAAPLADAEHRAQATGEQQQHDTDDSVQHETLSSSDPRISTAFMDDVSLGDVNDPTPTQPGAALESKPDIPPPVPARNSVTSVDEPMKGLSGDLPAVNYPPPPQPHGASTPKSAIPSHVRSKSSVASIDEPVKGFSGDLPSVNYPPPPPPPEAKPTPVHPPPPTRKVSSPFAWFSRATSRKDKAVSPSRGDHARSNTASSTVTLGSNADMVDLHERAPASQRSSLKDRFQLLRMQEESAPAVANEEGPEGQERARSGSMQGLASEVAAKNSLSPPPIARSNSFSVPAQLSERLPPGTASGPSAGPPEDGNTVNWDLWQSVVYEGPAAVARTSGEQLNRAIANGIPQPIRGVVWQVLADSKNADLEIMYRELVVRGTDKEVSRPAGAPRTRSGTATAEDSLASSASSIKSDASTPATAVSPAPSQDQHNGDGSGDKRRRSGDDKIAIQKLEKTIRRDLGARTSYSKYLASAGLQEGLFGLCKAYALFDEAVGYAQGMNFIAMPLLFNMPEEEAFTLFVRMMSKYDLRSMFTAEMTGLHLHLYQFERLLEDFEPALYCHLHRKGVTPNLYATQWFLTLFAYRFPLQLVLRVYDLILSEGLSAILKFGIVLMQKNAKTLMDIKDMSQLATYLKERLFDVYIDKTPSANSILESGFFGSAGGIDKEIYRADDLVRDACAVNITPQTLAVYAAEWEEQHKAEKEREAEIEHLRATNANLSTRVRNLEERAEQHDTEHVGIASELVRTKVINEKLEDENEGLKIQLEELKKVVDAQPAEVEEKLRAEMDRIMQRNIEVQNQNRALEETVQETEQELVGTKMMFAQLNAEHDGLKQKLANIQSLLQDEKKK